MVKPRIPTADSFVKPDLVFWNTEKAVVLDVETSQTQDENRIMPKSKNTPMTTPKLAHGLRL